MKTSVVFDSYWKLAAERLAMYAPAERRACAEGLPKPSAIAARGGF